MHIRFYIDRETQLPHLFKHDVSEDEAIEVFGSSTEHLHADRGAFMALGQTHAGRYLKVIYRKERGGIFVITAYDLAGKALRAYRRRKRRKRR